MTATTVRVLDRKIRRWEIETVERVNLYVREAIGLLVLPKFPSRNQTLIEWLEVLRGDCESAQMGFLSHVHLEAGIALRKDMRVLAGQLGYPPPTIGDRSPTLRNAGDILEERNGILFEYVLTQVIRQGHYAERYDDSWWARVTSEKPLRWVGRSGVGVAWSIPGLVKSSMIQHAYAMVNEERLRVAGELFG
jgi:hypothetical protein